jgi:hypothetical protein
MDLAICPSCKQSVLDDNPELCPFCGASMTGKPGGSRPAPPKQPSTPKKGPAPAASSSKPSGGTSGRSKPEAAPAAGQDDDPFAVTASTTDVVPVSPRKAAGVTQPVVCPMCESPGFIPKSAAGRDVKCYNKACMVPVFTAPALEKAAPPPPLPPPKSSGMGLWIGLGGAGLALAAGGAYFAGLFGSTSGDKYKDYAPGGKFYKPPVNQPADFATSKTPGPGKSGDGKPPAVEGPKKLTAAELEKQILEEMVDVARRKEENRSKALCRRLTGIAFARTGALDGAREQLTSLRVVGTDLPYYQIPPLVAIAWQELAAGKRAEASKTLDEAQKSAPKIPKFGRDALDIALDLATVLAAAGRDDEARQLLGKHLSAEPAGQLSAALAIVRWQGDFDLDQTLPGDMVGGWQAPQWVAATLGLALKGQSDQALAWAQKVPNADAKIECTIAWADWLTRRALTAKQPDDISRAVAAADALAPPGKARLLACLAVTQFDGGDRGGAEKSLAAAVATLKSIPEPKPVQFSGYKELLDLKLPAAVPLRQAALAAAEVARAQARLQQPAPAWASLQTSLAFARGLAPSPIAAARQLQEIETLGQTAVREQLKTLLELRNDDESRRRYNDVRRKLAEIEKEAAARFQLELELLEPAIRWNLLEPLWLEIRTRSVDADPNLQEPLLESILPRRLAAAYRTQGKTAESDEILGRLENISQAADPSEEMRTATAQALADGKLEEAAGLLNKAASEPGTEAWALRLACRLTREKQLASALQFVMALEDVLVREEALQLVTALDARQKRAERNWTVIKAATLSQTERESAALGTIEGLVIAGSPSDSE